MAESSRKNIFVDLDGTLALKEEPFNPYSVGEPVPAMLAKVRKAREDGHTITLFTARASSNDPGMHRAVREWLLKHDLGDVRITCQKSPRADEFWDDRAREVVPDKGTFATETETSRYKPCVEAGQVDSVKVAALFGTSEEANAPSDNSVQPVSLTASKEAKTMVRKERIEVKHDAHCPHCDEKFREKYHPRPKPEEAHLWPDCDEYCPACGGVVDPVEMTDEEINKYPEDGHWVTRKDLIAQREKRRERIRQRTKEAKSYPDRLRRLWLRQGKCPDCGKKAEKDDADGMTCPAGHRWTHADIKTASKHECYRNTCPRCGKVSECKCVGLKPNVTTHVCDSCESKDISAELPGVEKTASQIKLAGFHRPENWDPFDKRGDVTLYCGSNDWECANTWLWAETPERRVWIELKFPEGHPGDEDWNAESEKAWKAHAQAAKDTWRNAAGDDDATIEDFEKALKSADMQKYIESSGATKLNPEVKQAAAGRPMTGPAAILWALQNIDPAKLEEQAKAQIASGKITKRDVGVKMLNVLAGLKRNELAPSDLMITKVPVLPPAFRPFAMMGNTYIPGSANELYSDLFKHIGVYKETLDTLGDTGAGMARKNVRDAVRALYGYGDPVSPKLQQRGTQGYLHQITGDSPKFCYSSDTEILTRQHGWVRFASLQRTDDVATINPETLAFEWQRPHAYTDQPFIGDMLRFEVGKAATKRMDLLVTPNHRMWRKKRRGRLSDAATRSGWGVLSAAQWAAERQRSYIMTAAGAWSGVTTLPDCAAHWDSRTFAEFLGWYLSEGWLHECGTIVLLSQSDANAAYCSCIDALMNRLPVTVPWSRTDVPPQKGNRKASYMWRLKNCRPMVDWLRQFCGDSSGTKRIPESVRNWDTEHLTLLWHAFHKGDGAKAGRKARELHASDKHRHRSSVTDHHGAFTTTSPWLRDHMMEIAFKLGVTLREHPSYPELHPPQNAPVHDMSCIGRWFSQTESNRKVTREFYQGRVYCVSVPNGLLVVRRNGAAVVSGNSYVNRRLVSKPLDSVGRSVITVNPDLDMNNIGVPESMAWDLFGSFVQRRLAKAGIPPSAAIKHVRDRSREARIALQQELKERPVIYSRAPAWHKFNTIAGYAQLHDGNDIQISPYVTAGHNADFDGDQCVNQLLACIPSDALPLWRMSYHNIDAHEVRFPQGSSIPAIQDGRLFIFDLEDFPHGKLQRTKKGAKGRIDFHEVPHPIQVLAYDEAETRLKWADVAFWSKHYQREIEIVDTHNGYQLITDDDPRAVYGTMAGKLCLQRFTPSDAVHAKVLIPRARRMPSPEQTIMSVPGEQGSRHGGCIKMRDMILLSAVTGWVLGALCGDGWVLKAGEDIRGFALADNDGYNIAKLRASVVELLAEGHSVSDWSVSSDSSEPGRHGSTTSYRFTGTNIGKWLRPLIGGERDETTAGSANKHLPPFYLATPEEFRSGLLCGLLDTDGSISVSNGKSRPQLMASFGSTSIRLCIEVKLLAASLGIFGRITPSKTPLGKPCWMVTFSNQDIQRWGAPYMCHETKLAALRSVPSIEASAVTAKYDIVPISSACANAVAQALGCPKITRQQRKTADTEWLSERKATQALYVSFAQARNTRHDKYGAISRQQAEMAIARLGRDIIATFPDGPAWLRVVDNSGVTWERVTGVQKTGIREDGYDLTVPGFETFMAADGVILSNTLNVNVPILDDSVREAKEKLMPDKMLFSIKDPDTVMPLPKHEQVLSLAAASRRAPTKVHRFNSEAEALAAINRKDVKLEDEIEFPDL